MILVFDLDNTLYDELTYVESGFHAVARFLTKEKKLPEKKLFYDLQKRFAFGRGTIFNDVLKQYDIYSQILVKRCVSVYHQHKPDIKLYKDSDACLKRFSKTPMYIVTDGNKIVQANKIEALGLNKRVKKVFITHRFGVNHAKPSPYCFFKICEIEKTNPGNVIYIGDNPSKDFVGIKPLGFKTIRILRGYHANESMAGKFEAHSNITSLNQITFDFLRR